MKLGRNPLPNSLAAKRKRDSVLDFSALSWTKVEALRKENPGKYFCPVCGTLAKEFAVGGIGKRRKNAKCPGCGSLERHRIFWLYLINEVWPHLTSDKKDILHIAPERFFVDRIRSLADVNYISGDLLMPEAMVRLDLTDMQFWDEKFDLILCSHILEHIPDDRKAMSEMFRVLRKGGFLLVMVPTFGTETYEDFSIVDPVERRKHFGQEDHVRKYGLDIVTRLGGAGFKTKIWPQAEEVSKEILEFTSSARRIIFECRKL